MPKTGLGALYEHVLQTRMVLQLFIRTTWSKLLEIELNWIYWQTANEGRPRPEEIIGNAKINTKEKWRTYIEIKQHKQKTY